MALNLIRQYIQVSHDTVQCSVQCTLKIFLIVSFKDIINKSRQDPTPLSIACNGLRLTWKLKKKISVCLFKVNKILSELHTVRAQKLSSPSPIPFPKPPRLSPNPVTPSSKAQLVPRGLGLTLKSYGPVFLKFFQFLQFLNQLSLFTSSKFSVYICIAYVLLQTES